MKDTVFFRQAELLLRILPLIRREEVFALKGGTAINFFIRDLPRISVDIDLTYLPLNERDFALDDISHALIRISEAIKRLIPGAKIILKNIRGTNTLKGMIAENVTYEELETTRNDLRSIIRGELTLDESYKHYKSILSGTLHLSLHALP
ncbi:MAG: hypothetical protein DRH43_09885 [Deltaproteobacteria bacterium]|nr:MAG: hypothetical protein DRH43_09885 [Deltaproteobacteria bacterium]